MKIIIEFEAETPVQAWEVLGQVKTTIMKEFNPREWKRPGKVEIIATSLADGPGRFPKKINVTLETKS
jgi:hypothetical protein